MPSELKQAEQRLLAAIAAGRVPHACFLSCPDAAFSRRVAEKAALLFCTGALRGNAADCVDILRPPQPFAADDARALLAELGKRSFSGGGRAILLPEAHFISEQVQNILLKTIEEPPRDTLFLLSGNEAGLLPTILSRCAVVRMGMPQAEDIQAELVVSGVPPETARSLSREADTLNQALRLHEQPAYRALYEECRAALCELLAGKPPYARIPALCESDAEEGKRGRKKNDPRKAADALALFLSALMRLLHRSEGLEAAVPGEKRFTSGQIACMITLCSQMQERLLLGVPPKNVLARLFTEISEVAKDS